jgi:hypothetical protein
MFRSSMRSSSGSSLFIYLSMLLILKIIKIFKKYNQSIVVMWQHMFSVSVMRTVWRRARLHALRITGTYSVNCAILHYHWSGLDADECHLMAMFFDVNNACSIVLHSSRRLWNSYLASSSVGLLSYKETGA